jgi:HPt (histidine-containing phosphotransfer) domain-containing protein
LVADSQRLGGKKTRGDTGTECFPILHKPVVAEIEEAMSSYLDQQGRCSEAKPLAWKRSTALESVGGDEDLLDEVLAIFLVESPKLLNQMEQALLLDNPCMLELAAHSLRGALGYLGVPEASEAAQKLEDAGRTGAMEGAGDLLAGLRIRMAGLWAAVGGNPGG